MGSTPITSRVQYFRDGGAKPTPQWRRAVLPGLPQLCSQGDMLVWRKRHCMSTGNGVEALVHCQMLLGAGIQGDNLGHGSGNERATKGSRVYFRGGS